VSPLARVSYQWRQRVADLRGRGVYAGYPDRCQCIFIHIPKTAGSSIVETLFGEPSRHVPYFEYEHANPGKFQRYFKFAFVRNPWDRLVSTYSFLRGGGMNDLDRTWSETIMPRFGGFGDFVRGWLNEENVWSWVHFVPQTHFIVNEGGKLMVDYLGRFENIGHDFAQVARHLGCDLKLPKSNESVHRPYVDYYDEESREIVRKVYASDIAAFGYEFEVATGLLKGDTQTTGATAETGAKLET